MTGVLTGFRIALAEGRQIEDLARMLEQEGATVVRCPMVNILDAPDPAPIVAWLGQLIAGQFAYVIFLTGEGIRRLYGFAERANLQQAFVQALGRTKTVTRGPKPLVALKELGLSASLVAQAPTTDGVIATLRGETLTGLTVGVQLYRGRLPQLDDFFRAAGAESQTVSPYVYAPAADSDRVVELIDSLTRGEIEVLVFTSSPQIDRLFEVATLREITTKLYQGLAKTRVAAIGPIVADNLAQRGIPVSIGLERGYLMKNLVQRIKSTLTT